MVRLLSSSKKIFLGTMLFSAAIGYCLAMEGEPLGGLPSAETTGQASEPKRGMLTLLYGMSSVGKSKMLEAIRIKLQGMQGWAFFSMDDVTAKRIKDVERRQAAGVIRADIDAVVFGAVEAVRELLMRGVPVVCDMVLLGESVLQTEETAKFFEESLKDFHITKVFLGASLPTIITRVAERCQGSDEEDERKVWDVIAQVGRAFEVVPPVSPDIVVADVDEPELSSVFSLSPKDLSRACHSPLMLAQTARSRERSNSAPTALQKSFCDRVESGVLQALAVNRSMPRNAQILLRPRGLRPDAIVDTGRCSPEEGAFVALLATLIKTLDCDSLAKKTYNRLKAGVLTLGGRDFVRTCDAEHSHETLGVRQLETVFLKQMPGLFAYYPALNRIREYNLIAHDPNASYPSEPTAYYAAFFAANGFYQKYCPGVTMLDWCNDRLLFEQNILRHGIDIVKQERRKHGQTVRALGSVSGAELQCVLEGTMGLVETRERAVVVDILEDLVFIGPAFQSCVMGRGKRLMILFHPDEILPTWATMIVERGTEGVVATVIDPLAKDRIKDKNVLRICSFLK